MNEFKVGDRVMMLGDASDKGTVTDVCEQRACYRVLWDADEDPELHVASWWIDRVDE